MNKKLWMLLLACLLLTGCGTSRHGGGDRDDDDDGGDDDDSGGDDDDSAGGGDGGNGSPEGADAVPVGALVITEILAHPNASRPEFLELFNASDDEINLQACEVVDGGSSAHSFIINQPTPVAAGQWALLAESASLGAVDGELPVDVEWDAISFNQGDESESVGLNCPDGKGARHQVDTVSFDWNGMGLQRGRSWQLAADADATANDEPDNWCEAPAQDDAIYAEVDGVLDYGSPGGPAVCETLGGAQPQAAGEVVITELLIDSFTGLREWFEIHNPGTENIDIRNCVIGEGTVDGSSASEHTVDYELGSTVVPPGGYLLLARGADVTTDGSVVADYPYSSLAFPNSGSHMTWMDCPVGDQMVRIDQITFDWSDYGSSFKGYSLSLSPTALSADANDDAENWCLAGDGDVYFTTTDDDPDDPTTYTARGTPGQANPNCPEPGLNPGAGDLVITEILIDSLIGMREWFELYNPGTEDLELVGCTMVEHEQGAACLADDSSCRHEFDSFAGQTLVPAGDYLLLARTAVEITTDGLILADYAYSGTLLFSNSGVQELSIVCADELGGEVVVDTIFYDWSDYEDAAATDLRGRSLVLSSTATSPDANDLSANWCPADDADLYYSGVDDQAWGSPGAANPVCVF